MPQGMLCDATRHQMLCVSIVAIVVEGGKGGEDCTGLQTVGHDPHLADVCTGDDDGHDP